MNKNMRIRKVVLAIFALFLACNLSVFGQEVTKENYDKAVDYLNCKTVEFSLKLSPTKDVTKNFQEKINCEKYPNSSEVKGAIPETEEEAKKLSDEIDKIKTDSFQPTEKGLITKYLINDVFSGEAEKEKFPELHNFAVKISVKSKDAANKDFIPIERLKLQLQEGFKGFFSQTKSGGGNTSQQTNVNTAGNTANNNPASGNTSLPKNTNPPNNSSTQSPRTDESSITLPDIFSIALALLALLMCLLTYWSLSNDIKNLIETVTIHRKIPSGEKRQASQSQAIPVNGVFKKDLEILQNKLNEDMEDLEIRLKAEIAKFVKPPENNREDTSSNRGNFGEASKQPNHQQRKESSREVFYSPKPTDDGNFNVGSVHSVFKDGESIYKFTKISERKAEFVIDDRESSVLIALRYPDHIIEPACQPQNSRNESEKRIVTVQPGEAMLDGDKWKVTKKAVIRYEH